MIKCHDSLPCSDTMIKLYCKHEYDITNETSAQSKTDETAVIKKNIDATDFKQGYETGFKKGEDDAKKAFTKEKKDMWQVEINTFNKLIHAIEKKVNTIPNCYEDKIIEISFAIIRSIFTNIAVSKKNIQDNLQQAFCHIKNNNDIHLHLHPKDYDLLKENKLLLKMPKNKIHIKKSDKVKLGGCYIENNQHLLDMRLETQIEQLKTQLLQLKETIDNELP